MLKRGDATIRPLLSSGGATFELSAPVARLLRALHRPRVLRDVIRAPLNSNVAEHVVRLVLDGVLEIEHGGRFVSGADAWIVLCVPTRIRAPRSRPAQLTLDALAHGERLLPMPVTTLAYRLYRYNTIPCSARWSARFPSSAAVGEQLGISGLERQPRFRESGWAARRREKHSEPWLSWFCAERRRAHAADAAMYKLYVSPEPAAFRDAFQIAAPLILESEAIAFKVGGDVFGVLRPDKMVIYFSTHAALMNLGAALQAKLTGVRAHGVPFTASLDSEGLISCGADPRVPPNRDPLARESWRLRVAGRLAGSLAVAGTRTSPALTPSRFALARLALDGADLLEPNADRVVRQVAESFLAGSP